MPLSAWLVGSLPLPAFAFEVNGAAVALPAGTYYLRHATIGLSLIDRLEQLVQAEVPTASLHITQGRRVRLVPQVGDPVSIDWGTATALRDLLGFAGDLALSGSPRTASIVSPLLWSPGWPATPTTVGGTAGRIRTDATHHVSADGTRKLVTTYYEQVWQELRWTEIEADRLRVDAATAGGGTYQEFYEQVLKRGHSVRWYAEQMEADGDTTAVTWDDSVTNSFGPYVIRDPDDDWYTRIVANVDLYSPLELRLMRVAEYS